MCWDYYADAIADRMEDGMGEPDAVAALGSPVACAAAAAETVPPLPRLSSRLKQRFGSFNLVVTIATFPVWGLVALAVALAVAAVYVLLWSVVVALWCFVGAGFLMGGVCAVAFVQLVSGGAWMAAVWLLGVGLAVAGAVLLAIPLVAWAGRALIGVIRAFGRWLGHFFRRDASTLVAASTPTDALRDVRAPRWSPRLLAVGLALLGLELVAMLGAFTASGFNPAVLPHSVSLWDDNGVLGLYVLY